MAAIIENQDIVNGQTLSETADNVTLIRKFIVRGDTTGPGGIFAARFANGIPSIGDVHPTEPTLTVENIGVVTLAGDRTLFTISCNYSQANAEQKKPDDNAPAQLSVGTTTTTYRTDKDRDGNQMVFEPSTGAGPAKVKALPPQTFIADVPRVLGVFRLVRRETTQPGSKAMTYTNKVNSKTFLGLGPGLVYCDSIQGDSSDGGDSYVVTYSFTADPLGWTARGVYTIDNEPVNDPAPSEANKTEGLFDVLDEIDFNVLNLQ